MTRWKARVEFLLSVIELLFPSLTVEALQGKTCQNSPPSGGVGQFEPRFQGEGVVPWEYFFCFYKTRHILLSDSANCTVLRASIAARCKNQSLTLYYRATHFTAMRGIAIVILSVCLSVCYIRDP